MLASTLFPANFALYISAFLLVATTLFTLLVRSTFSHQGLRKKSQVSAIFLLIVYFLLGTLQGSCNKQNFHQSHQSIDTSVAHGYTVQLTQVPRETKNSIAAIGKISCVHGANYTKQSSVKIQLYFAKSDTSRALRVNDEIAIYVQLQEIQSPKNPGEFNYKSVLHQRKILFSAYVPENKMKILSQDNNASLKVKFKGIQEALSFTLRKYIVGKEEYSFASALLLGNKATLDRELKQHYIGAGAMHVLAVSGLHVGLIYLICNLVLRTISRFRDLRHFHPLLLILCIWIYALITGASPSVLRAATMFSFLTLGSSLKRHMNVYNTLAASALVLLLIQPTLITEVGFQLSYAAVIGIIFIQPKLYRLLHIKIWLLDKIWGLTTVSIAAQLATFPLSLYYFHQFPNYFWLSNLIVIPAATIIVGLGVVLFLVAWLPLLPELIGKTLYHLIHFTNKVVISINTLPYSKVTEISISLLETLMLYVMLVSCVLALHFRNKALLKLCGIAIILFCCFNTYQYILHRQQELLVVYSIKNHSSFELINGKEYQLFTDKELLLNSKLHQYHIQPNHRLLRLQKEPVDWNGCSPNSKAPLLIENKGYRILWMHEKTALPQNTIAVDFAIISNGLNWDVTTIANTIRAKHYIFDSSLPAWKKDIWKDTAIELDLNYYFVTDTSAFIYNLN